MVTVEKSLDDLLSSLAYALAKNLPLLRKLAAKPNHIPRDEDYQEIARRQAEHLKQSGVEKIIRHVSEFHSWPPRDPPAGGS
jgi:hypothetical protein